MAMDCGERLSFSGAACCCFDSSDLVMENLEAKLEDCVVVVVEGVVAGTAEPEPEPSARGSLLIASLIMSQIFWTSGSAALEVSGFSGACG